MRVKNKTKMASALLGAFVAALVFFMCTPHSQGASKKIRSEGVTAECTGQKTQKYTGKIQSLSLLRHTITVMSLDTFNTTRRIFEVAGNCKISTKDKKQAALVDLKLDDEVEIKFFSQKDGSEIACSISQKPKKASQGK